MIQLPAKGKRALNAYTMGKERRCPLASGVDDWRRQLEGDFAIQGVEKDSLLKEKQLILEIKMEYIAVCQLYTINANIAYFQCQQVG
jgi:hypothetical protein